MPKKKAPAWRPGQSGNPKGRRPGIVDRRALIRRALEGDLPHVLAALVERAKAGDVAAIGLILSRTSAPLRPAREPIVVEGIPSAATATEIAQALVTAATRGELPSDAAAELVAALGAVARLREVDELAARLAALEAERNTQ